MLKIELQGLVLADSCYFTANGASFFSYPVNLSQQLTRGFTKHGGAGPSQLIKLFIRNCQLPLNFQFEHPPGGFHHFDLGALLLQTFIQKN